MYQQNIQPALILDIYAIPTVTWVKLSATTCKNMIYSVVNCNIQGTI